MDHEKMREGRFMIAAIFAAGFIIGLLFLNFRKSSLLENTGVLDEYTLYRMKYMTVDSSAFLSFVLRKRVGRILLLVVLSTTYLGMAACVGNIFWYGMCSGMFVSAAMIRYGVKGILLVVVSVFPQVLIYIPAMLSLLAWCTKLYRGIYHEREVPSMPGCLFGLARILFVFAFGILLECYINPYLMLGLLKIY